MKWYKTSEELPDFNIPVLGFDGDSSYCLIKRVEKPFKKPKYYRANESEGTEFTWVRLDENFDDEYQPNHYEEYRKDKKVPAYKFYGLDLTYVWPYWMHLPKL
jgi:hypothetical protein